MEEMNLKEHIDETMEDIRVNDSLKKAIMKNIQSEQAEQKPAQKWNKKKIIVTAAAAALIAAFPLTVGAEAVGRAVSDWVYSSVNANVADEVYPIYNSCTDNGIKVEVESAVNDSHRALIFLTLQDVEGKGRLSDVDFLDSYSLSIGGHSMGTTVLDSYDPETQTARFYTDTLLKKDISGQSVTFRLERFMAHKTEYPILDTGVDLSAISQENPKTGGSAIKEIYGIGYVNATDEETDHKPKKSDLLTPDVMDISLGEELDFVHITNIGYVNGKLHIQTKWDAGYDNHGELELCRKEITDYDREDLANYFVTTEGIVSIDFATAEDLASVKDSYGMTAKHIEYLFDVKPDELKNYKLLAVGFVKDGEVVTGDWSLAFQTRQTESLLLDGGSHAKSVEITPLGIYVEGCTDKNNPNIAVSFRDGSNYQVDYFSTAIVSGLLNRKTSYYSEGFTDHAIGDIVSVFLNDEEIYHAE